MKLEMNKNELAGALIALGKLICRTSTAAEFKTLRIEAGENQVRFSTCSQSEQITFKTECRSEGAFHCIVGFDEFRDAVRSGRNKTLELENGDSVLRRCNQQLGYCTGVQGIQESLARGVRRADKMEPVECLHGDGQEIHPATGGCLLRRSEPLLRFGRQPPGALELMPLARES